MACKDCKNFEPENGVKWENGNVYVWDEGWKILETGHGHPELFCCNDFAKRYGRDCSYTLWFRNDMHHGWMIDGASGCMLYIKRCPFCGEELKTQ